VVDGKYYDGVTTASALDVLYGLTKDKANTEKEPQT